MACIAPPPPVVTAVIQIGAGYQATFRAADPVSANYLLDDKGDWDFSCFKQSIKVHLTIGTTGVVFYYGGGKDGLSYSDDPTGTKQPVTTAGNHQIPGGPTHVTAQAMWFMYHNDWDGGQGDGNDRYPRSAYGLYLGDGAGNFLTAIDPVINNGGNNN